MKRASTKKPARKPGKPAGAPPKTPSKPKPKAKKKPRSDEDEFDIPEDLPGRNQRRRTRIDVYHVVWRALLQDVNIARAARIAGVHKESARKLYDNGIPLANLPPLKMKLAETLRRAYELDIDQTAQALGRGKIVVQKGVILLEKIYDLLLEKLESAEGRRWFLEHFPLGSLGTMAEKLITLQQRMLAESGKTWNENDDLNRVFATMILEIANRRLPFDAGRLPKTIEITPGVEVQVGKDIGAAAPGDHEHATAEAQEQAAAEARALLDQMEEQ